MFGAAEAAPGLFHGPERRVAAISNKLRN